MEDFNIHELIEAAGGQAALAKMLGYDPYNGRQRVYHWKQNGIPSAVVLRNYKLFRKLLRRHRATQERGEV